MNTKHGTIWPLIKQADALDDLRESVLAWMRSVALEALEWVAVVQWPFIVVVLIFALIAGALYAVRIIDRQWADRFLQEKRAIVWSGVVLFIVVPLLVTMVNVRLNG